MAFFKALFHHWRVLLFSLLGLISLVISYLPFQIPRFLPVELAVGLVFIVMSLGLFHFDSPVSPLLFFGPFCLLIGYLIFRSSFLPRILGVAMTFAGLGWLAFLLPVVPNYLSIAIKVIGFLAELSLCLWLLVMGVDVQRWKQQASPAKTSIPTGEPLSATKG